MRLLVCGSRDWTDRWMILEQIVAVHDPSDVSVLIHGCAPGADRLAGWVAEYLNIPVVEFPADWKRYPKVAGPIRNQQMLDEGKPELVFAFKDGFNLQNMKGAGTEDMIRRTIKANIPWRLWSHR